MSFCKQPTFASKVFVDEVSSADHKKLCNFLETILAWAILAWSYVNKRKMDNIQFGGNRASKCRDCEIEFIVCFACERDGCEI